jgi:hypothetical protein
MAQWGRGAVFSSDSHVLWQFRCSEGVEIDTSAPFCGRGTLQVKDAVTGKMVPLSVLESEQDKAARKIRNMNRTDAQTGALFAQAIPQAPCSDTRHCHFPDEAHLLRQSLSTPDALCSLTLSLPPPQLPVGPIFVRRVRAGSPADGILREGDALVEVDGANVWKSKAGPVSKKLIGKSVGPASGPTPRKHSTFLPAHQSRMLLKSPPVIVIFPHQSEYHTRRTSGHDGP